MYDSLGNEIEMREYIEDVRLYQKLIHKYDKNGNKTETSTYNSLETLVFKYVYKYDSQKIL